MRKWLGFVRWQALVVPFLGMAPNPARACEVYMGLCFAEQLGDPKRQAEWETVARQVDGTWLNLAGWPDPRDKSPIPALRLIRNNQKGIVPMTVVSYKPEVQLSGLESAEGLKKAGVFDWQIISLNGDSASNRLKEPFRAEAVQAVRAKYPDKKVYVNVRIGSFTSEPNARIRELIDAADGATFESEPKRFLQTKDSYKAYSAAYTLVKTEKKKPLVWLCPNGGMGVKEDYLSELKQVFGKIREMKMIPDIITIIGYGRTNGPLDELPEGKDADYPSTLTGATRWMLLDSLANKER